jgi:hypothetical protein
MLIMQEMSIHYTIRITHCRPQDVCVMRDIDAWMCSCRDRSPALEIFQGREVTSQPLAF